MPDSPRSSFIPKQSSAAIPATMQRRKTFHVFGFLSTVLLIASVLSAGGAYLYKGVTEKGLEEARAALRLESEKFGIEKLNEVRDFNRQLLAVDFLLDQHIAPSKIFDVLEFSTMQRVQFMNFKLEYDPSLEVVLTVRGGTEEFKTVALQALQFGGQALFKDAIFKELGSTAASDQAGKTNEAQSAGHDVNFTVTGSVAPSLLVYEGTQTSPTEAPTPETTQSPTAETPVESTEPIGNSI